MNKITTNTALYMKLSESDSCEISRIYISIDFKRIAVHDTWFKKRMYVICIHSTLKTTHLFQTEYELPTSMYLFYSIF